MQIPPWLTPPNYSGIMESAARLSLGRRAQESSEQESAGRLNLAQEQEQDQVSEAGDRLRLAYSQLGSQERQSSQAMQARLAQSNAALQLRAQQQQSLDLYRQQMAKTAAERLSQTGGQSPFVPTSMDVAGRHLIQLSPNRYSDVTQDPAKLPGFKPNPVDTEQLKTVSKRIADMSKTIGEMPDGPEKDQIALSLRGAEATLEAMRSKFVAPGSAGAALTSAPKGTTTGTSPAPSPFKEGQLVRSKKDGKTYRIRNGVPVPMGGGGSSAGDALTQDDSGDDEE